MTDGHDWYFYEPIGREICLHCGFYRSLVEGDVCRWDPSLSNSHNNPVMVSLLKDLRERRAQEGDRK